MKIKYGKIFAIILLFSLILFFSNNCFAQDKDPIDEFIQSNQFIINSDVNISIYASYLFKDFLTGTALNDFNLVYYLSFNYSLFSWLLFETDFSISILDTSDLSLRNMSANFAGDLHSLSFIFIFDKLFLSLPFTLNLQLGIFDKEFRNEDSMTYTENYYFGIPPIYSKFLGVCLKFHWWLFEVDSGIYGLDDFINVSKFTFFYYDFAFISLSGIFSVKFDSISQPRSAFFIEAGLSAGFFNISFYLSPAKYQDTVINEDRMAYNFGGNIYTMFNITNRHIIYLKIFADVSDENGYGSYQLLDILTAQYYNTAALDFSYVHPSRAGLEIEYEGSLFENKMTIDLALFVYYVFDTNSVNFNSFAKIKFYWFFFELNYFTNYYPYLDKDTFYLSCGLDISF
jgi:hypothetical protein